MDAENFTRDFNEEWLKYARDPNASLGIRAVNPVVIKRKSALEDNSSNLTIVSSTFFDMKVLTNEVGTPATSPGFILSK